MADYESVKERIIQSVFAKRNATSAVDEAYVAHLKIWEIEGGNDKPRFIILAESRNGLPLIHKSRLNPNGTFSVGKTWTISELHAVEVVNDLEINITFARTYVWHTESQRDQGRFLSALTRLFRETVGPNGSLQTSGFSTTDEVPPVQQPARSDRNDLRSVKSAATIKAPKLPVQAIDQQRAASPLPRAQTRTPASNGRPASPSGSFRSARTASPSRIGIRPSSPAASVVGTSTMRRQRRPSNATSARSSESSTPGQLPSIYIPAVNLTSSGSVKEPSPLRVKPIQPQAQSVIDSRPSLDVPSPSASKPSTSSSGVSPITVSVSGSSMGSMATPSGPFGSSNDVVTKDSQTSNGLSIRTPSPAPSTSSRRSQKTRAIPVDSEPPMPSQPRQKQIIGQPPIPTNGQLSQQQSRRDPKARISFFDPANQALLDRLLFSESAVSPQPVLPASKDNRHEGEDRAIHMNEVGYDEDLEEEGDTVASMLGNIEEMLEGYEWIGDGLASRTRKGPTEAIESRLLDELLLLERANIHSLLESDDDRIAKVLKGLDEAIAELDTMESTVSSYKIHLNAVSDDILYIQSQNRGLQVQTQNQKALLNELEILLQTVHVNRETLITLTQESLEKGTSIPKLEEAATELYKALLAGRDNDMAATMERLEEYRTHNSQFCKRILDFMTIMFTAQSNMLLGDNTGVAPIGDNGRLAIVNHQQIETYLGRYCGLMLYLKEMDESKYSKVCAAYFSSASDLHSKQMKALFSSYVALIKQAPEEDGEQTFSPNLGSANWAAGGLRRAGTVVRSPIDARREKNKQPVGTLRPSEALDIVFEQLAPQIYREEQFIADFLQINDAALTYADYMNLDHYFRRQAAQHAGLSSATMKLVRGAMDLIFGFLPADLKSFVESALEKDAMQIVGVIASAERAIADAEERGNVFFSNILEKQHQRLKSIFDRHVDEQIKGIEHTKLNSKKRRGVAHFIKYFPIYVNRIELLLVGTDDLEIRGSVDAAYDRIVQAMFDCLRQMAKMDGEQSEDKGQLNYHVILIDNMHHFITEISQSNINAVASFKKRAESIYDENVNAYVKIVLRRPFSKIIDYFEGVERLLKTTAPTEVSKNGSYNRSALKRVVKEYNAKDVRKLVDVLFKRVEKHFTDADAPEGTGPKTSPVLANVWKACEGELLRITDLFMKRISQCYADANVSLEYSRSDIEGSFKRHRGSM